MKPILTLSFLSLCALAQAQTKVTWGDEFKMRNDGTSELSIIHADQSGEYLEESYLIDKVFFSTPYKSTTLVKLNPSLSEVYRKDFDSELKGKDFEQFLFLNGKLYLLASDYSKQDKATVLYAAEVDESTGHLTTEWQSIHQWHDPEKNEHLSYKIVPDADGTGVVLAATYWGKEKSRYELQALDVDLKPAPQPLTIYNEFEPKTFQVEGLVYTHSGNAVVVGRIYGYEEGKPKKDRNLIFKNYSIRIYDAEGHLVKELTTDSDNKYFVTSKVMLVKNELVLAAFYSKERRKKEVNGMIVQRIDPATGNVLVSTEKELNASSITQIDDEDADKRALKKAGADEEGLSANLRFNKFYLTPDNGVIILAERCLEYISTISTPTGGPNSTGSMYSTTENFDCGEIYMGKVSAEGNFDWIHVLPKSQFEGVQIASSWGSGYGFMYDFDYFHDETGRPYYSGFGSIEGKGHVHLFFNDDDDNAGILEPGQRVKKVRLFGKTSCYEIDLDMMTGKYTRKAIFSNRDIPNAMPRLGVGLNGCLYMTGKEMKVMRKSKVAVGKIVCTD